MPHGTSIVGASSLPQYFHRLVSEAISASHVGVSEQVEHYLVQLLSGYAARAPSNDTDEEPWSTPLAFLLRRAVEAPAHERMRRLRELGDAALYVGGFFSESLTRRRVNADYFAQMGGGAYATLSDMLAQCSTGRGVGQLYGELANRFADLVGVLNDIADSQTFDQQADLLRLYNRWLQSRSDRLFRHLAARGMVPVAALDA